MIERVIVIVGSTVLLFAVVIAAVTVMCHRRRTLALSNVPVAVSPAEVRVKAVERKPAAAPAVSHSAMLLHSALGLRPRLSPRCARPSLRSAATLPLATTSLGEATPRWCDGAVV